jgi:signal peptidase I
VPLVNKKHTRKFLHILLDFFELTFIGAGIFVIVFVFIARLLVIDGQSMEPTFHHEEQLIAERVSVKLNPLKRGEIVVFKHPQNNGALIIKRLIGLPGETIKMESGKVYINGELLEENYLADSVITIGKSAIKEGEEFHIPSHHYVMLGDNRGHSTDSRDWGPLSEELIVGRGFLVYYPFENLRIIN